MKVLVCVDGSRFSEDAVGFAGRLLRDRNAEVTVLRVVPEIAEHFKEYEEYMELFKDDIHRLRKMGMPKSVSASLEKAAAILGENKVAATFKTRKGKAAEEIIAEAQEGKCDMIIVASYGHGISKFKLGSVSREVVHLAHCPVLVYKEEEGEMF